MKTNKKKVLIALDYDTTAEKVAKQGLLIAKSMNAEVILIHVTTDPINYNPIDHVTIMGFAGYLDTSNQQITSSAGLKKASKQYLEKAKQHLADKTIQTIVGDGDVAESILKTAKDEKVDIIVMGSHSRKNLEYVIIGSITGKVLQTTPIPVIIIPTKN